MRLAKLVTSVPRHFANKREEYFVRIADSLNLLTAKAARIDDKVSVFGVEEGGFISSHLFCLYLRMASCCFSVLLWFDFNTHTLHDHVVAFFLLHIR